MVHQVKDPALSLQWLGLLLWLRFNPWPGNFLRLWGQGKKKAPLKVLLANCYVRLVGRGFTGARTQARYPILAQETMHVWRVSVNVWASEMCENWGAGVLSMLERI